MLTSTFLLLIIASSARSYPFLATELSQLLRRQTPDLEAATDRLLFSTSIDDFTAARNGQDPPGLDWSSNGCTASPDNPFGFNFYPSCTRHDFGYRNYKAQSRFSGTNKARVDSNFKNDMFNECLKEDEMGILAEKDVGKDVCEAAATIYYEAVRIFGRQK